MLGIVRILVNPRLAMQSLSYSGGPVFTFNLATSNLDCIEHPEGSFGLQCGVGGEFFEKLQLSVGYLWGLSYDVRTVKLDNFSAQNRGWQINLAWLF